MEISEKSVQQLKQDLTTGGFNIILVTGCAGFIGWKTCSLLLEKGEKVVGIDPFARFSKITLLGQ